MSRAGMLQGALSSLFNDAAEGSASLTIQLFLIRVLLSKGILAREDIIDLLRRMDARAEELGKGPDGDTYDAADMREARDMLVETLNRDPGLAITVTEPDLEARLRDKDAATQIE